MQRGGDGKRKKDVCDMQTLATRKDCGSDARAAAGGVSAAASMAVPAAAIDVREARASWGQGGGCANGMACRIVLPLRTVSEANGREHWAAKARRVKLHRQGAYWQLRASGALRHLPCVVTLVRVAPRDLDGDNLQSSLKACRDGVADWLQVDDRDPRVTWNYEQRKGQPKEYAVEVIVA
jgi:hypothetical protein